MEFFEGLAWWQIFFSLLAGCLLTAIICKLRGRGEVLGVTLDSTGLEKYHKDTLMERREILPELDPEKKKRKKIKAKKGGALETVCVIEFEGDTKASGKDVFSKLIDEVLVNRSKVAEVVVIVSSPGGMVPHYGFAYAEMERIRSASINLTVCINVVAASGGYLMSLPANKIVAAPFALVGSVGVVAFIPNLRDLLLSWKVKPRTFTAGEHKRTVTLTDDGSPEREEHLKEQLESIHRLFISSLEKYRPHADIKKIQSGDAWSATESVNLQLGLVDEIDTSSGYLLERNKSAEIIYLSNKEKKKKGIRELFSRLFGYLPLA